MSTRFSKRASIMIIAAICSLPVSAQRPGGGPPRGAPDASQGHEFRAGYLSLTESQEEQVKAIFAPQSATESMRGQLQSKQDELQAAVKPTKAISRSNQQCD